MNPVFIIIRVHSVFEYNISISYSLSYSHLWRIPFDESRPYYHSHSFGFKISHFNFIITFVLSFKRYTQSMYLFHILIPILIHVYSFIIHSLILIHVYSFINTQAHIHSRILIHVYSFINTQSYIHSRILIHVYSFINTQSFSFFP